MKPKSIIRRLLDAFGVRRQYVLLVFHDKERAKCKAYKLGDSWFAHPYRPNTRCKLLPGGDVEGPNYINRWEPITPMMKDLFTSWISMENAEKVIGARLHNKGFSRSSAETGD